MAKDTNQHTWGSDVYHRPDPETDCPVVKIGKVLNAYGEVSLVNGDSTTPIAPLATMAPYPWDDCLTRIKLLEQEVTDLKEFVHELADQLNVRELRRQRDERRKRER